MKDSLRYELIVPGQVESLSLIGEFVTAVARRAGFDEKDVFGVQLAADEACTNVIEHAYTEREGSIHIVCFIHADSLEIQIHDSGAPFDPNLVPEPDLDAPLEERETGGLGLHFMRTIMDVVRFDFTDGINHLTMIKSKTK